MEITTQQRSAGHIELAVKGRLDAYWADHLAKHLEEVVRGGARGIRLHMGGVTYISSMGIRVLVDQYKQLHAIQGWFGIAGPSPQVSKVLALSGLLDQLMAGSQVAAAAEEPMATVSRPAAEYEIATLGATGGFHCRTIGKPELMVNGVFSTSDCRTMSFPRDSLAIGLGAFGSGFEDSRNRFGEFLAAAGSAAYQPTDGSNVADYVGAAESLVPEVQVLYALACAGTFSHLLRFQAKDETSSVGLSELVADCLTITQSRQAAFVMVAESTGLLGAWLRKSPAANGQGGGEVFAHPEIRRWLAYTPDRLHARSLSLVVGVAVSSPDDPLVKFVRPMGARPKALLHGHFHSALFPYQPLKRGRLDAYETVRSLFSDGRLQAVLHLLSDDRGASGAGESEFVRGACWAGPITGIGGEGSAL